MCACVRLRGLLRLQELYIFLLHFIQRFHGLPVFGPQVLEQGQIQLWPDGKQFGVKVDFFGTCLAGMWICTFWKPYNNTHVLFLIRLPPFPLATAMLS